MSEDIRTSQIGGDHYKSATVQPWDLQRAMVTSGSAFVDARRADVIRYVFRVKGDSSKLLEDMKKAAHCLAAGIEELEKRLQ